MHITYINIYCYKSQAVAAIPLSGHPKRQHTLGQSSKTVCGCLSGKGIVSRYLLPGLKWLNDCRLLGVLFHNTDRQHLPLLRDICLPFKILHKKAVLEHHSTALGCTGRRYLHLLPCIATRLWWHHPKNQCRTRGGSLHTCAQSNTITLDIYSLVDLIVSP